ncbi:carbon-nitrogen family hydrolase [Gracilibacillus caseinilyticus]|uniref:Carbon-nitrogen family hydrolase n=1 Tax=Gracilibacillus caseinilyticus TaxID=2932256 RepID=A0ABY4EXF4_9BACI|nr:carbon-nitrogen family hydrolase [Gracilibacillus caseinilyticus]UOQ48537.1 carbon-nitrogen family hydrolase [Gracilibacillus caseinilyticus]
MEYAIYQMDVIVANPQANREKIKQWFETDVTSTNIDTVVLPEMWNTGYALDRLESIADDDGAVTIPFLSDLAKKYQVNVIGGSIANRKQDGIYNTSFVFNRLGELVHQYDKIHLVPMLDEPKYLKGGCDKGEFFELDGVKMGIVICYDLRFPELIRSLVLQGAEVIHVVAQWPASRRTHWHYLQFARAIENQCYMIAANASGRCDGTDFAGESLVISPSGEAIATGPARQEATIQAEIMLEDVRKIRNEIPVFTSRVPYLYGE